MKKLILITLAMLVAQTGPAAAAQQPPRSFNVLVAGGPEANVIRILLTPDGRQYVIDSIVPLEVGGSVCANPEGRPNQLICEAPRIAGFEVNADGGDDKVVVAKDVAVPVTLRGGSGADLLVGGFGPDKLVGGAGRDRLIGRHGDDVIAGGPGNDVLFGGHGDDLLLPGPGRDMVRGGPGTDHLRTRRPGARARR